MLSNQFKGATSYNACLQKARNNNEVGIHKHTYSPGKATDRLGFVGKRPSKKTMKELGYTVKSKPKTEHPMTVEEVKALLAQLEGQQAKQAQPTPTKPVEPSDFDLRAKLNAQNKAKMQQALNVPQYGRNVYLKLSNQVG